MQTAPAPTQAGPAPVHDVGRWGWIIAGGLAVVASLLALLLALERRTTETIGSPTYTFPEVPPTQPPRTPTSSLPPAGPATPPPTSSEDPGSTTAPSEIEDGRSNSTVPPPTSEPESAAPDASPPQTSLPPPSSTVPVRAWDSELARIFDVPLAPLGAPDLIWASGFNAQLDLPSEAGELFVLGAGTAGVNALDPTDGAIIWQSSAGFRAIDDQDLDLRVIDDDGATVVARSSREVWTVDLATGEDLWRRRTVDPVVTVFDDRIVLWEAGQMTLLQRATGDPVLEVVGADDGRAAPSAGLALARTPNDVAAFDREGVQIWRTETSTSDLPLVILAELLISAEASGADTHDIVARSLADGAVLWRSSATALRSMASVGDALVALSFADSDIVVDGNDGSVAQEIPGRELGRDGILDDHDGFSLEILEGWTVVARSTTDGARRWSSVVEGASAVLSTDELALILTPNEVVAVDIRAGVEQWRLELGIVADRIAPIEEGFVVAGARGDELGALEAYRLSSASSSAASKV